MSPAYEFRFKCAWFEPRFQAVISVEDLISWRTAVARDLRVDSSEMIAA